MELPQETQTLIEQCLWWLAKAIPQAWELAIKTLPEN